MKINLSNLSYQDKIDVDEYISYSQEYLEKSKIKKLDNVHVIGFFYQNDIDEYICNLDVSGTMILEDSITLEDVNYPFSFKIEDNIEENLINNQNTLDLIEFLWQNIVLEVPIRFTKSDAKNLSGENWQLIDENEEKVDPRLEKLKDYYKGGE